VVCRTCVILSLVDETCSVCPDVTGDHPLNPFGAADRACRRANGHDRERGLWLGDW